jgi:hypothetical protein
VKRDKEFMNRVKGRTGNMDCDIVSPAPILMTFLDKLGKLWKIFQEDEENLKAAKSSDKGIGNKIRCFRNRW